MITIDWAKDQVLDGQIEKVASSMSSDNVSKEFAKELFLFLYDYTNSFKNANTTPEILELAGETLKFSIEHDKLIVEKIKKSFIQMKICAEVIENIRAYNGGKIIGSTMDFKSISKYRDESCIIKSFMDNILLTVTGVEIAFLIFENDRHDKIVHLNTNFSKDKLEFIKKRLPLNEASIIENMDFDEVIKIITSEG